MDRTEDILNRVLHNTVNSVVQYIGAASPYVPPGHEDSLPALEEMRSEEAASANELTDAITQLDAVPQVGVFPYWNVDLNYLDLRFLARFAVSHQERAIAEIEGEMDRLRDDPKLFSLLTRILEQKRAHRAVLQEIGKQPEPGPDRAPAE